MLHIKNQLTQKKIGESQKKPPADVEITLQHGCSPVNLPHIFRTSFPKNTSGRLLLDLKIFALSHIVADQIS